jgi:preprotein translocase subunit SecF
MNIIKNRYLYFLISLLVIVPGIIFMAMHWVATKEGPLALGIDFRGGSLLEIQFSGKLPPISDIQTVYNQYQSTTGQPLSDSIIQPLGTDAYSIRSKQIDDATKSKIVAALQTQSGETVTIMNFSSVSASVGAEVTNAAGFAILAAAIFIILYIWYAFRSVEHPVRYGTAAIIAMFHDVFVVLGVEAMLGYFLHWEADSLFLTALLTVIGFSVHDTIVVFDRIRENANIYRRIDFETLVNHSVVQTLDRSINTQLTVMFTLFALALFGGETTRHFVIILLAGIFSGTYSSIFNASPILVVWENREWRNWFHRKAEKAPQA